MIDGLVAGRLYGDSEQRTDKAGKPFTVAKVRANTADGELLFVNVIAFEAGICAEFITCAMGIHSRFRAASHRESGRTSRATPGLHWTWWRTVCLRSTEIETGRC